MTAEQSARQRAEKLYDSKQFQGIYVAGARAALRGTAASTCPYDGPSGWNKTRRIAWMRGHQSCRVEE